MKRNSIILLSAAFAFITGCKTYKPVLMPQKTVLPSAYNNQQTDSTSIASFKWKQWFADSMLISLIDTALANNPDLLIAGQRLEVAKAYLSKARGAFNPTLNGVVSAGFDKFGDYTMNGVGNFDTNLSSNITKDQRIPTRPTPDFLIGLRSSWEIDIWGKLRSRKKAAIARLLATESGRRFMITSLVSQVAVSYYQLLALNSELNILSRNSKLQADALDIVKAQKEGGRATELAVQQFEAQLFHTKSVELQVKQQIVATEAALNYLMGRTQQPVSTNAPAFGMAVPASLSVGIPAQIIEQRPDIQQTVHEMHAAEADVDAARAAYLPSLVITPYIGLNAFSASRLISAQSAAFGLLGGLTAPLLNKNEIKTDYFIANARNKEAIYNYRKAIINGFNEVVTTISGIENTRQVIDLKQNEVNALHKAVASANELYLAGYATYLEVITAQKSVLESELELNTVRRNLYIQTTELYRALGGGWQ